ncbi:MAG: SCP2 sterol-binding domain-containing protein [Acidimicrobiales bacterium]
MLRAGRRCSPVACATGRSRSSLAAADGADVTVALPFADAVAVLTGETSAEAAYMRGALKVEGHHALWLLDLGPVRHAVYAIWRPIMAQTEF